LFVTLLNVRDCAPDFAKRALMYRNDLDSVGLGKVCVVVQPCSTFSYCCQLETPLNGEVQNLGKKLGFIVARGRQNKLIETKFGT